MWKIMRFRLENIKCLGIAFVWLSVLASCGEKKESVKIDKPKEASPSYPLYQADPTVFYHDGTYYLYGTNDERPDEGFLVYTSTNMKSWRGPNGAKNGSALVKGDAFGTIGFWAPQVWESNGKFYMAYTANEKIAIATSDSPLGPFSQVNKTAISSPVKQIDPFVFIDDDGKKYLFHVRLTNGNRIFVAEMTDDFSAIKPETLQQCITATDKWENVDNVTWSVTEGPTVLKHKGLYYLIYTANDFRHQRYAVGYAVSNSVYGPWEKYEGNPILSIHNTKWAGTGHGDMVRDKDNKLFYVFHTHHSASQVGARRTGIAPAEFVTNGSEDDILNIHGDDFYHISSKND